MTGSVTNIESKSVRITQSEMPVVTDKKKIGTETNSISTEFISSQKISNNYFANYGFIRNLGQAKQYANDVLNSLESSDPESISRIVNNFSDSVVSVFGSAYLTENTDLKEEIGVLLNETSKEDEAKADEEKIEKAVEAVKNIMDRLNKTETQFVESRNAMTENYQPIESEKDAENELKTTEKQMRTEQEKFLRTHANDMIFRLLLPYLGI